MIRTGQGNPFREIRERKGLTQQEVARTLGISRSTIYRIEAGKISPTIDMMRKLGEFAQMRFYVSFGYPDSMRGTLSQAVNQAMQAYEIGLAEGKASCADNPQS